jgi:hypothetical protein
LKNSTIEYTKVKTTEFNNDCKTIGIKKGQKYLIGVLVTIAFIVVFTVVMTGLGYVELVSHSPSIADITAGDP